MICRLRKVNDTLLFTSFVFQKGGFSLSLFDLTLEEAWCVYPRVYKEACFLQFLLDSCYGHLRSWLQVNFHSFHSL